MNANKSWHDKDEDMLLIILKAIIGIPNSILSLKKVLKWLTNFCIVEMDIKGGNT